MPYRFRLKENSGKVHLPDRVLQPGDIWTVEHPNEIPKGFRNSFDALDSIPVHIDAPQPNVGLVVVKRPGGDLEGFDVYNEATGTPMNDGPLTLKQANSIVRGEVDVELEKESRFRLHGRGGGWWDVVDTQTNVKVNDRALHFPEASDLAKTKEVEHAEPPAPVAPEQPTAPDAATT